MFVKRERENKKGALEEKKKKRCVSGLLIISDAFSPAVLASSTSLFSVGCVLRRESRWLVETPRGRSRGTERARDGAGARCERKKESRRGILLCIVAFCQCLVLLSLLLLSELG